jgi:pimeloyl-ACP methyl ester carboxylesterase
MERISLKIKNNKNLMLSADLALPAEKRSSLVILLPGFTERKDDPDMEYISSSLVVAGFMALKFDAAGTGESEGSSHEIYRVSQYYEDIESIVWHCVTDSKIDAQQVSLYGHSMGGMLAIIYAAHHPHISGVCAVSPTSNILEAIPIQEGMAEWKKTDRFEYRRSPNQKDVIGYGFVEDAKKWNAEDDGLKLAAPLLMILGESDTVVPVADSLKIYQKLHGKKKLLQVSEMGHYQQAEQIEKTVISFFKSPETVATHQP